jgi:3-ketosteroid 9alpha-monooxygenase subunit B
MNSRTPETLAVPVGDVDADGFATLPVRDVVRETVDAVSLVFDIPLALQDRFRYRAGQFVTLRVEIGGEQHRRCYSMSSSPAVDSHLRITVKRDRQGLVSNWLNDHVAPGDLVAVAPPEGRFVLDDVPRDIVAFAGGSGITPVFSLLTTALAATPRRVRLFYANRGADSIIFRDALTDLARAHSDRLTVHHHLDDEHDVVTARHVSDFLGGHDEAEYYICGPGPFMDTVETTLLDAEVPVARVHMERFTSAPVPDPAPDQAAVTAEVTIVLNNRAVTMPYRPGTTLLQTARLAGLKAPSSCETGSCGTCMAQVTEGSARMLNNDALDDDEVADGWVVTCQSLPTSPTVRVVYD